MNIKKLILAIGLLTVFISAPMYAGMFDWFWNLFESKDHKSEQVTDMPKSPSEPASAAAAPARNGSAPALMPLENATSSAPAMKSDPDTNPAAVAQPPAIEGQSTTVTITPAPTPSVAPAPDPTTATTNAVPAPTGAEKSLDTNTNNGYSGH